MTVAQLERRVRHALESGAVRVRGRALPFHLNRQGQIDFGKNPPLIDIDVASCVLPCLIHELLHAVDDDGYGALGELEEPTVESHTQEVAKLINRRPALWQRWRTLIEESILESD